MIIKQKIGVSVNFRKAKFPLNKKIIGKYSYLENLNAKPSGSAGGGKWKKVMEHLGNMTGPEPDWSLSPQKMGVPSPWSPTNVAWSPVGGTMLDWKKKRTA